MLSQVAHLIEEVAREVVVPRFGRLRDEEIHGKPSAADVSDIVTIVDRDAETLLARGLQEIAPAPVLGEEAAHAAPDLLRLVGSDDALWVVDPLDGTRNFAAGDDAFGVMVSWVIGGRARAGWIHLPMRRETFVAEEGSGATLNGTLLRVPPREDDAELSGAFFVRFMPQTVRGPLLGRVAGRFRQAEASGCAAVGYTDIARGRTDFLVYYRLLPWDHSAPALVLTEAGGCVMHVDERPYSVRSANEVTIVGRSRSVAREVRALILQGPA